MSRLTLIGQITAAFVLALLFTLFRTSPHVARADEPSESDRPGELPDHLQALQKRLGGSVVNQFDTLRSEAVATPAWWRQFRGSLDANGGGPAPMGGFDTPTWGATWPGTANVTIGSEVVPAAAQSPVSQPYAPPAYVPSRPTPDGPDPAHVVTALRQVAARLDTAANRLEGLELYQQADALRGQAQALRMDARRKSARGDAITPAPAYPTVPTPYSPNAPQLTPTAPTSATPPRTDWHNGWSGDGVTSGPTLGTTIAPTDPSSEPGDPPVWTGDAGRAASQTAPAIDFTPRPAR